MQCLSMYNVDGSMRRTCKSKLSRQFNKDLVPEKPQDTSALWLTFRIKDDEHE